MSNHADNLTFPRSRPRIETLRDGALRLAAPAKINLNLLVGPPRDDGFHGLDSCVAKITLYDDLTLRPRRDGEVTLTTSGLPCGDDEQNLALRAARALAQGRDVGGADVELVKRIAPGGGLGGGSSDAASTLWGLRELWQIDVTDAELARLAATLGSDVPLFLGPAASRMTGRGELLSPIDLPPFFALLIVPDIHCATAEVYRAFDATTPGPMAEQLSPHALAGPPSTWRHLLKNDLAAPAQTVSPRLAELRQTLAARTVLPVCITGSGSAMFVLCDSPDEAVATFNAFDDALQATCIPVRSNQW